MISKENKERGGIFSILKDVYFLTIFLLGIILSLLGIVLIISSKIGTITNLFGNYFLQTGITVLVVNILVTAINNFILNRMVEEKIRGLWGVHSKETKLLPVLTNIIRPYDYINLFRDIIYIFEFSDDYNETGLLNLYLSEECKIKVEKENTHFIFKRGIPLGKEEDINKIVNWVIFDDKVLFERDLKDISKLPEETDRLFLINQKLKEGSIHKIIVNTKYIGCMSDLIKNKTPSGEDYITFKFVNLTFLSHMSFCFPIEFDIDKYEFEIRLRNLSGTLHRPIDYKREIIKIKNKRYNRFLIELENLDNGDTIIFKYWLKNKTYKSIRK